MEVSLFRCALLALSILCMGVSAVRAEAQGHREVSGIYPHLAMFNGEDECGTGAVVPWAGDLWVITYGPHCPLGSTDRLYRIKPDLTREEFPGSVGGTHANRMIHRETNQMLIGPYVIDAKGNVRVIPPMKMPGRLTANARHLFEPARKAYYATMEAALFEVDLVTLEVNALIQDDGINKSRFDKVFNAGNAPRGWYDAPVPKLPGYHGKGMMNGFGRLFYANNGEQSREALRNPFIPAGALGWWNKPGDDWHLVRRCQFTEVTTADGIYGNEHPESNPVWAMGWDAKSVVLGVTTNGSDWAYYRLPKASHAYDGAHGWNTEWPRIRDVGFGDGTLLATMHGTFWRFPRGFSPASPNGIRPLSTYLKVVGDFCRWGDRIVFGCDDQARSEFLGKRGLKKGSRRCERSQSNLWFVKPEELGSFGPPSGEGCVWLDEDVKAGDTSDPYLYAGYETMRFSFCRRDGSPVRHELLHDGDWVRVKCLEDANCATAKFSYGPAECAVPALDAGRPFIAVEDDNGRTWRFPNVNGDTNVVCREIATERDILYVGGVWYEVPAENAGGFAALRPIALADEPVRELYGEKGLMYLNGRAMAIDDLWKNGTAPAAYWLWERARDGLFHGAEWIAAPESLEAAAPRFKTTFKVESGGPAEIAICGLGQYVATLNGKPLGRGDEFNLPGWTRTSKTCFYNVFRPVLKAGEEYSLEIVLGDGMYNVPHPGKGLYTKFVGSEGGKRLLVGGVVKSSVEGWMVAPSEVVRTHVYAGDDVDHRVESSPVVRAVAAEPPCGKLQEAPFVCRLMETMRPVKVMRAAADELTVDFGQNAAYVPSVVVKGPRSSRVELEFSEIPLGEGETRITAKSSGYGNAVTRCAFTLAGNGEERFSTPFFYCGFRYMRVRLVPAAEGGELPELVSAEARVVMADAPEAGSFECSNSLFNKIHEICRWAQRSNMQSVFTDCPHREKLGWQEQDHIHAEQIRWGWNADAMFAKTCMDIADSQLENGLCPDIAPEYTVFAGGFRDSVEWGSSVVQIPWQQYEWSGDDSLIRQYYPNMVAYHRYVRSRANDERRGRYIAHGGLGDWYEGTGGGGKALRRTSKELTATVFHYKNAEVLAKCADMLGRKDEAEEFRREAMEIKKAFNAKWWHPETASYENNSQTANAMALASGLADEKFAEAIVSNIVADVRERGNAVAAGEIGYPYLLKVLSDYGRDDVVFDMVNDSSKPGYGYMIAKGNTTCHEAWNANPADSHNHFMMADIVNWFYGSLGGIRPTSPGFRSFVVEPRFMKGLDWAKARHKVATGYIRVEWRRVEGGVRVSVAVPDGTKATVRLPGSPDAAQGPGEKTYFVQVEQAGGWGRF